MPILRMLGSDLMMEQQHIIVGRRNKSMYLGEQVVSGTSQDERTPAALTLQRAGLCRRTGRSIGDRGLDLPFPQVCHSDAVTPCCSEQVDSIKGPKGPEGSSQLVFTDALRLATRRLNDCDRPGLLMAFSCATRCSLQ